MALLLLRRAVMATAATRTTTTRTATSATAMRIRAHAHMWLRRTQLCTSAAQAAIDDAYRVLLDAGDSQERVQVTDAQAVATQCAMDGYSVFLHLPTGAGKSLAFQAPALAAPPGKTTLVVSPLIALIHDQVSALRRKGVRAVQVSGETRTRNAPPLEIVLADQRLVYTTPEFLLQNAEMQQWVRRVAERERIARVVLDEAHCVLEWGNSFRPAYLELSQWRTRFFSALPLTLATASVTDDEIAQLAAIFHLEVVTPSAARVASADTDTSTSAHSRLVVVQQVADRANLHVEVVRKPRLASACANVIARRVQRAPTVVYCLTRREAEDACLALVRAGCHAGVYHGGLPRKRREFVRKQWMGGQLSIMCATSAFGMGIDRADVRFVVHHSLPLSLASYLQQIGRAGRDGEPAVCLLLFDEGDKSRANAVTTERDDDVDGLGGGARVSTGRSHAELEEVAAFCSTAGCRRELLYAHFGFPFAASACARSCNCGPLPESCDDGGNEDEDDVSTDATLKRRRGIRAANTVPAVPKMQIEYLYQRVLVETKKLGLPKREALSRRVVQDILERAPASEDEMAALRGVGEARARRLFQLFASR